MTYPAVFIDRDGTLVEARHYPSRPDDLVLYEGICDELRILQSSGFKLVLITNQSGIARGYFSENDLARMHEALCNRMRAAGVSIDAIYYCPHHIDGVIPNLAVACECRKPEPGMLLRAAGEHDLDLTRSWFAGDILDDVEAGNRAGCRTVLVDLGTESAPQAEIRQPDFVAPTAVEAMRIIQAVEGLTPGRDLTLDYLPRSWTHVSDGIPRGVAHAGN